MYILKMQLKNIMNWLVNNMANVIDMRDFDCMFDNLEEYFNKHGYTLGNDADRLQELMHCIQYCYIHGVATGSQIESMKKKFRKQVSGSLKELDNVKNGCIRGRRLTDKEYKEMLFREQVKEEERVSKMMELLTLKLESDKGEE